MITRNLLAALVGLSLAAGALGTASAQTTAPSTAAPATQMVSPTDATAPTAATKTDTSKAKPVAGRAKHTRMKAKSHHKHLTLRTGKQVKTAKHLGAKRIHLSHLAKRGSRKHV